VGRTRAAEASLNKVASEKIRDRWKGKRERGWTDTSSRVCESASGRTSSRVYFNNYETCLRTPRFSMREIYARSTGITPRSIIEENESRRRKAWLKSLCVGR
jgi:hypothetical protein